MIPEFVPISYDEGISRVYKEVNHLDEILYNLGFVKIDRWYEKDDYKVQPLRSGDLYITQDGRTIFHGLCLDGREMSIMMRMIGIIER